MRHTKQVIVIRKDLGMRKGKMCSQAAHASMAFLSRRWDIDELDYEDDEYHNVGLGLTIVEKDWFDNSFTKITVSVNSEKELLDLYETAREAGLEVHLVTDNGTTEFNGVPTNTCIAIGPDYADLIDPITKDLLLL